MLWNKYGKSVDALVSPLWHEGTIGELNHTCVTVTYLGNRRIGLDYNLATGNPHDCNYSGIWHIDSWKGSSYFLDSDCNGKSYHMMSSEYKKYFNIVNVEDAFYYIDGAAAVVNPDKYYFWNTTMGQCLDFQNTSALNFWEWKPVPDWVINALPDYPYTLTLEY